MSKDKPKSDGETHAGFLVLDVLTKRSDFLRCSRGKRHHSHSFVLQGWNRRDDAAPRIGYTCSKKVGNAVARNRAKRRLREIARLTVLDHGQAGWDYVLIGRAQVTATTEFAAMTHELETALKALAVKK